MGCDIHAWIEKRDSDGEWNSLFQAFIDRNYWLFGVLASVRRPEADCIHLPKGFPADADVRTINNYNDWDADAHNVSWLTLQELLEFDWDETDPKFNRPYREWSAHFINTVLAAMRAVSTAPDQKDVRLVFWFDN